MAVRDCLAVSAVALAIGTANAAPLSYRFDTPLETKATQRPFDAGGEFQLNGLFGPPSAVVHEFRFTAGSASAISLSNAWVVTQPPFRLVGVNIDLLNATQTVVASDTFNGVVNGQAFSTLSYAGLTAGADYTVTLTGTAQGTGRYQINASSFTPAVTAEPVPPGPAATPLDLLFDTRQDSKTLGAELAPGQALRADAIVSELAGGFVDNTLAFTLSQARDFAGAFTWITGTGTPRETVGFNADLLDSNGNLVASDQFQGTTDGQAFSTFDTFLPAGDYRFEITATSQQAGTRYRLDVAFGGDAPAFVPLPPGPATAVPEPASGILASSGLLALIALRRRSGRLTRGLAPGS